MYHTTHPYPSSPSSSQHPFHHASSRFSKLLFRNYLAKSCWHYISIDFWYLAYVQRWENTSSYTKSERFKLSHWGFLIKSRHWLATFFSKFFSKYKKGVKWFCQLHCPKQNDKLQFTLCWCVFPCLLSPSSLTTGFNIAIYKDTVPWPSYTSTYINWTLMYWEWQTHTHNLILAIMLNGNLWTLPLGILQDWLLVSFPLSEFSLLSRSIFTCLNEISTCELHGQTQESLRANFVWLTKKSQWKQNTDWNFVFETELFGVSMSLHNLPMVN